MFPHILHNCLVLYSHQLQYLLGERVQMVSSLVWPHDVHFTRYFSTSWKLLRATRYWWLYKSNATVVWIFRIFHIVRNLIDYWLLYPFLVGNSPFSFSKAPRLNLFWCLLGGNYCYSRLAYLQLILLCWVSATLSIMLCTASLLRSKK